MRHLKHLNQLQTQLWGCLPVDLRAHCELANYRDKTLVIAVHSPVWASRLKLSSREILHAIQAIGKIEVQKLRILTMPS